VIYQYQGQITKAVYGGQYVLTLKGGGGQSGAVMTWNITTTSGTSGNQFNTSVLTGQPWMTVITSGSKCADVEEPPAGFGTPDSSSTGRKLQSAASITNSSSDEDVSAATVGSKPCKTGKPGCKPVRPKPCRNRHGKIIRCPRPPPSPSPKPIRKPIRMYFSREKRIVVYHNPVKPCPVYYAGSLPTTAAGQAALAKQFSQEWRHIAAAQRLLPARAGAFVLNRCACKSCSDAAKVVP
jgi:hypothetical protein